MKNIHMIISFFKKAGIVSACFLFCLLLYSPMTLAQSQSLSPPTMGTNPALPPPQPQNTDRAPGMQLSQESDLNNPFEPPPEPPRRSAEEIEADIREQAFNAAITGLLPLQPNEIRKLLEHFDNTKQAVEVPIYPYPEPEVVVETVSLDPGARPPEIKLAAGHVTTLNVLDVTGQPWPIQDVSWAGNFEIIQPEPGSHVVRITPMSDFAYGNISVRLLELKTPVTFILKAHRDKVQYRFDARIPEFGPYASSPLIEGGVTLVAGNSVLNAILDGVPPAGAQKLDIGGADSRTTAYAYNDQTYVRSPLTLLSPGWSSSVSSADGMNVYALSNAPVLLLSDRGQIVRAHVSEKESDDE